MISNNTRKIIVEVPHRISGFFEIVDKIKGVEIKDPERIGSRGAGFCVNAIGKTEITAQVIDDNNNEIEAEIYINGEKVNQKAETTYFIVNFIKKYINKSFKIRINHFFELPVGCGYGASGSGALGTIFGLDYLLDSKLGYQEKGKIAHIAEVVNRTGLGTVCGQLNGGIGILKEPGFPCVYERFKVPQNLKIICGTFGIIPTKSILTNPVLNLNIKEAGRKALEKLIKKPDIKTFINTSIEFVKKTKITDILELHRVKELMDSLNKLEIIGASMNQLGRSVYAICRNRKEKEVLDIFKSYKPDIKIFNTSIHKNGSIILKKE